MGGEKCLQVTGRERGLLSCEVKGEGEAVTRFSALADTSAGDLLLT